MLDERNSEEANNYRNIQQLSQSGIVVGVFYLGQVMIAWVLRIELNKIIAKFSFEPGTCFALWKFVHWT